MSLVHVLDAQFEEFRAELRLRGCDNKQTMRSVVAEVEKDARKRGDHDQLSDCRYWFKKIEALP